MRDHYESRKATQVSDEPKRLRGELAISAGKACIVIPPQGHKGAIPFMVSGEHEADTTIGRPAWADLVIGGYGGLPVRVNPELLTFPYFRLCDCLLYAWHHQDEIKALGKDEVTVGDFQGTRFVFSWHTIAGMQVVFIDYLERAEAYAERKAEVT